jgi:Tol biopolymer transport system component
VLVALARARGAVVSRDDLIQACWGGVVVGEDAINRTIVRIRRLSADRTFTLETIPKIGYRLTEAARGEAPPEQKSAVRFDARWLLAAAAAALAASVAFMWLAAGSDDLAIDHVEIVAQTRRSEMHPALSPDGRFIVYTVGVGSPPFANLDLVMRSIAGGEETVLTDTDDWLEFAPAFSPLGDRLAFVRFHTLQSRVADETCRIMVRDFPNGLDRQVGVCEGANGTTRLSWTPDGAALVYADDDLEHAGQGPARIDILDVETGRARTLIPPLESGMGDFNPSVSPDGRRVAFVRYASLSAADVFVYDMRSARLTRITEGQAWAQIAWADARRLFILSRRESGGAELWLTRADSGAHAERLLPGLQNLSFPSSSPGLLAMQVETKVENLRRLGAGGEGISNGNQIDHSADFSAAGDLAFISTRSNHWLYLAAPGEEPRPLVELRGREPRGLRWSPDGRRLVYAAILEDRTRLFIVDAASGVIEEASIAGDEPGNPAWSADGRSLIYAGNSAAGVRLLRVGLGANAAPQPISDYGWAEAIETAEGLFARKIYDPGIWRLAQGRAPELVFPESWTPSENIRGLYARRDWTLANGRFYAVDQSDPARARVLSRRIAGGPLAILGDIDGEFGDALAVDPRSGAVIYGAVVDVQNDIALIRLRR